MMDFEIKKKKKLKDIKKEEYLGVIKICNRKTLDHQKYLLMLLHV